MLNTTNEEDKIIEDKMIKWYFIVRYIGLILWTIGMVFAVVSNFFCDIQKATLFIIGTFGIGLGMVFLFVSTDIEMLRNKRICNRTEKELQEYYKQLEKEEK